LPRLSIQRVAMGQSCDVSRLAAFLRLRITTYHHRVSCKYSRSVRLSASGSSRSPAESRLRRTNWSISASRNSINKQRSPFRRRARYRCMRRAAAERVGSIVGGDVSAVSRSWTISAPVGGRNCFLPTNRKYHDLAAVGIASMTLDQTGRLASSVALRVLSDCHSGSR
jgi:hypothetical protein